MQNSRVNVSESAKAMTMSDGGSTKTSSPELLLNMKMDPRLANAGTSREEGIKGAMKFGSQANCKFASEVGGEHDFTTYNAN